MSDDFGHHGLFLYDNDDDFVDRGMGEKGRHASLQNGAPADRQELLGPSAAEPLTEAAGRDDS